MLCDHLCMVCVGSLYRLGGVVTSVPGGHRDQTAPHEYTPLIVG